MMEKTKYTINQTYLDQLETKGYVVIPFSIGIEKEDLLASLGEIILKTEIKENQESTRLLASHKAMPLHTDHYVAKYIAWFCHSQSYKGGESILVDTKSLINSFSKNVIEVLKDIQINSHKVFYNDKLQFPLLSETNGNYQLFYAPWLVPNQSFSKTKKAIEYFQRELNTQFPICITLNEGDILIINNHRVLHGRNEFPQGAGRWLTRYWLSGKQ